METKIAVRVDTGATAIMKWTVAILIVALAAKSTNSNPGTPTKQFGFKDSGPVVNVPDFGVFRGKYETVQDATYEAYLGIRYGLKPTESYRFYRARAVSKVGNVDATSFGHRCPQPFILPLGLGNATMDEDCLNLNVFRPKGTTESSNLSVVIIIHGGGFSIGSSADALYHGGPLAALGNVVTVSFNYRLGVLGFADMGEFAPGNLGLWDQQLAFIWVQRYIQAFGGNPGQVTLLGVSAGSMSISAHIMSPHHFGLLSPLSRRVRLFHSVIMDAGVEVPALLGSSEQSYARVKALGKKLGCDKEGYALLGCLRRIDAMKLVNASYDPAGFSPILTFFPTLDNYYLPKYLSDPIRTHVKDFLKVRVMSGYSPNEGSLFSFYHFDPTIAPEVLDTNERLIAYLTKISRGYAYHLDFTKPTVQKSVLDTYNLKPSKTTEVYGNIARFMTDGSFACPMNLFLKAYGEVNQHVYAYHFARLMRGTYLSIDPRVFGVYHTSTYMTLTGALLADQNTKVDPEDLKWFLDGIKAVASFANGTNTAPEFRGVYWPDFSTGAGLLHLVNGTDKPAIMKDLPFQNNCRAVFSYYDSQRVALRMRL